MLREGQRQKDEAMEPRPEEGTPTSSIIAPHDSAERAGDDDTKPFRNLEEELTARMGPPPPRVKRKVARPQRQPSAEPAPEEETPEEGADFSDQATGDQATGDQATGQVPARTAARTPARTPAQPPAQADERVLTFTPAVFTPLPSPPSPWSYVAGAAAVLFLVLAGWRFYEANEMVAPKTAGASVTSEELLRNLQALQQERSKVDVLTRELALAKREQQGAQATSTVEQAALEKKVNEMHESLRKAEALSGILDTLLAEERKRNVALADQVASDQRALERMVEERKAEELKAEERKAEERRAEERRAEERRVEERRAEERRAEERRAEERRAEERRAEAAAAAAPPVQPTPAVSVPVPVASAPVPAVAESVVAPQPLTVASAQPVTVAAAQPVTVAAAQPLAVPSAPPVARPAAQPPSAASVRAAEWLLNKARVLLGQGEVGAARAVLEQATEAGGAPALFALAETYDPAVLARWGTVGTLGDVARARELYGLALAAGAPEARARLMALP